MRSRSTIGEARWPDAGEFVALAKVWQADAVARLLGYVWAAYDLLLEEVLSQIDCTQADRDLERSVTQYLVPRIGKVMPANSPFYVQHGSHEFETAKKPPAQPPLPDVAFVLWANERIRLPLEAKTLRSDRTVGEYVREIRVNFLTCRYAPFSSEGGMLGYLVAGQPAEAFHQIAAGLPSDMRPHPDFPKRNHRLSDHKRTVPVGKRYPQDFRCHHLLLCLTSGSSADKGTCANR